MKKTNCRIVILDYYPFNFFYTIKVVILITVDLKEEFSLSKEDKRNLHVKTKVETEESSRNENPW